MSQKTVGKNAKTEVICDKNGVKKCDSKATPVIQILDHQMEQM